MTQHQRWSVKTVDAWIRHYPLLHMHPLLNDCWNYESGCMLKAIAAVYEMTENPDYLHYIRVNMDAYVDAEGDIRSYRLEDYNLDQINQGKLLLFLYKRTGESRYLKAARRLAAQLRGQPRTSEGAFWHKKIYPFQIWLDGLYMAAPFLAEYALLEGEPELMDLAAAQLLIAEQRTRDPRTGLLHHGYDESREQRWADPEHGRSPHAWGRAVGWYGMAAVDVLDFLPVDHRRRGQIIGLFERLMRALARCQDKDTGLWHQVLGEEGRPGNYVEASASCMIVYAALKALNRGCLSPDLGSSAERGLRGILEHLVETDEQNGQVLLHRVNRVAGLGGTPYRDGSFAYYISEPVVVNDPKGVAPFILACAEAEKGK